MALATMEARPSTAYGTGWLPTCWAHRPAAVSAAGLATWVLRWMESRSIFVPARPMRPGKSVTAAIIETVTTSATAAPMPQMAGRPARQRPRMATQTGAPAKRQACDRTADVEGQGGAVRVTCEGG